ncbi:MAG TPA: hypothetical protein VJA27_00400 [Patescibacteria group bacterium]|nr:hypothetical protein [Patescibacteria group bacterium]
MTTIVNTPAVTRDDSSVLGTIVGIVILAIAAFFFVVYGVPYLRRAVNNYRAPAQNTAAPNQIDVRVPERVDVNVNRQY